jgi:hypothetical protein
VSSDYFLEIESHFAARRGTPFVLNAKDWALMKEWADAGIPLAVVLEAIDTVFARNEERGAKKTISSLRYCRHAVKETWADRQELQVGAEGRTPEENVERQLEELAATIDRPDDPTLASFAPRIRGLRGSVPAVEEKLIELESELIESLLATSRAGRLRSEAESLAAGVDEKTRARTVEANLRRLVREEFGVPRLTLFR